MIFESTDAPLRLVGAVIVGGAELECDGLFGAECAKPCGGFIVKVEVAAGDSVVGEPGVASPKGCRNGMSGSGIDQLNMYVIGIHIVEKQQVLRTISRRNREASSEVDELFVTGGIATRRIDLGGRSGLR